MDSSSQPPPPPPQQLPLHATVLEETDSSLQDLVAKWQRRQRWQQPYLFHCCRAQRRRRQDHHNNTNTKRSSWRTHLSDLLESTPVHLLTLLLILLDLALTILDLYSSLLISCLPKGGGGGGGGGERNGMWFHWGGVAILAVLSAKMAALVVALGTSFFGKPGRVVDGVVVVAALVLEVAAEGKGKGAGLLVVVSLWRVVRLVESAFELSNEAIEGQIEGAVLQFDVIRDENRRLEVDLSVKDEKIFQLEQEISRFHALV